jgi:hypothetical protein
MSISSCPRCTEQVTLPVGISNNARVRCPKCRAEYTLADALVNMPPMLEVIGDGAMEPDASWFDMAQQPEGQLPVADEHSDELTGTVAPAADQADHQSVSDDDLLFEAVEIEQDDLLVEQPDTVIEDPLSAPVSPAGRASSEPPPVDSGTALDNDALDFGVPAESVEPANAEEVGADDFGMDFGQAPPLSEPAAEDAPIEFGAPLDSGGDDTFGVDSGEPETAAAGGEAPIDFGEPMADGADELALDFEEPAVAFEPVAAASAAVAPSSEAAGAKKDKKSKKKEKKEKAPKPPRDPSAKRSLVGTMVKIVLPSLLAIPLALYGALFIGKDYDFFNIGPKLPAWMAPAAFAKKTIAQNISPQLPPTTPLPDETAAAEPPAEDSAPPALDASASPPPPVEEVPQPPSGDEPRPAVPPAANVPAAAAPPVETAPSPAVTQSPDDKDASLESLLADDKSSSADKPGGADTPEEMPAADEPTLSEPAAEKPAAPAADLADAPPQLGPKPEAEPIAPGAAPEELGPTSTRDVTPAELSQDLQRVSKANDRMAAAVASDDKNELKKVRAAFYVSLYGLADSLASAKDDPLDSDLDTARQNAERLALEFAGDPAHLKELKSYGAKWMVFAKRTTQGVALAGTVQSAKQVGKLYHLKMQVTPGAPEVTVVSEADPDVAAGDEVLTLGSIVQQPTEHLGGYQGQEAEVVWSGMTLKLPATGP